MKTIVIFSGGLDSATMLWYYRSAGHELKALSVNYGQRHSKELMQAQKLSAKLGVEHKILDLSGLKPFLSGSSQTDLSVDVPEGNYDEESMAKTVVPNRNLIMLSCAVAWAISLKFDNVATAVHAGDHFVYLDCRESFLESADKTFGLVDAHPVKLLRPFVHMTKADIASLAGKLQVPVNETWSCYKGGDLHCSLCGTCRERREAMKLAGIVDTTPYANEEQYQKVLSGAA